MTSHTSLNDKIALVTGASRGIGYATACLLASHGAHILATARTQGGLEDLQEEIESAGGKITLIPLDLRDGEQLDSMGPAIFERFGKLDILVSNAAILGPLSPIGHLRDRDWSSVIETNLTANWRLIRATDPLLKLAKGAKVLFVTDSQGEGAAYWTPYAISKAGLESLAKCYAAESASHDIQVIMADPGPTETRLRKSAFPGETPNSVKSPEESARFLVQKLLETDKSSFSYHKSST